MTRLSDGAYNANTHRPLSPQVPAPRSGCQMAVSLSNDVIFIHGGYSKVKQASSSGAAAAAASSSSKASGKAEGFVHEDTWALQLKNVPNGGQPFWERVSRKGTPPSARSGASMVSPSCAGQAARRQAIHAHTQHTHALVLTML